MRKKILVGIFIVFLLLSMPLVSNIQAKEELVITNDLGGAPCILCATKDSELNNQNTNIVSHLAICGILFIVSVIAQACINHVAGRAVADFAYIVFGCEWGNPI